MVDDIIILQVTVIMVLVVVLVHLIQVQHLVQKEVLMEMTEEIKYLPIIMLVVVEVLVKLVKMGNLQLYQEMEVTVQPQV